MEKHFFNRYMKSLKHNLLYELSHADVDGYNRNKSQWNSTIYKYIADRFRFWQIPQLLRSFRDHSLVSTGPMPHDAAIAWCLLDSVGREFSRKLELAELEKNPFEFNVARVRNFSVCIPSLRYLTLQAMPCLSSDGFELTTPNLVAQFPVLSIEAEKKIKQAVSRMRELRNAQSEDSHEKSFKEMFDLALLVRLMGEIRTWGIDDFPTNRFLGLE